MDRISQITKILDEKKGEDIEVIDLLNQDYLVDYVVIVTSLNNKHTFALLDELRKNLKPLGEEFLRVEEDDNWSIIDLGDIFIHIMTKTHRDKYSLEEFLQELKQDK